MLCTIPNIGGGFQLLLFDGQGPLKATTDPKRDGERPVLNTTIMLFLVQDGITSGAIYALLGLALVLVFAVTRVILIPQGEFVTFGALTYATLSTGNMPGTAWLAVVMGVVAFGLDLYTGRRSLQLRRVGRAFAVNIVLPVAIYALTFWFADKTTPIAVNIALSLLIVAAIGLFLYRIVFQPLAHTSVLVLLIASVGAHLALQGLGLVFFGAEGLRGPSISDAASSRGPRPATHRMGASLRHAGASSTLAGASSGTGGSFGSCFSSCVGPAGCGSTLGFCGSTSS